MINVYYPLEYLIANNTKTIEGDVAFKSLEGDSTRFARISPSGKLSAAKFTSNEGELIISDSANNEVALPNSVATGVGDGTFTLEQVVVNGGEIGETSWKFAAWQRNESDKLFSPRKIGIGNSIGQSNVLLSVSGSTNTGMQPEYAIKVSNFQKGVWLDTFLPDGVLFGGEITSIISSNVSATAPILITRTISGIGDMTSGALISIVDNFTNSGKKTGALIVANIQTRDCLVIDPRLPTGDSECNFVFDTTVNRNADDLMAIRSNAADVFNLKGSGEIRTGGTGKPYFMLDGIRSAQPPGNTNTMIKILINNVYYEIPAYTV